MRKTRQCCSGLIGIVLITVLVFAGSAEPGNAQEVLKFGSSVTLSGPGAVWGVPDYRVVELQFEEINKAGGVKIGGKTYILKQIAMDNKYSPEDSVAVATRLMEQEKVKFFHPSGGVPTLASIPVINKYKVLTLSGGYGKGIVSPENPYLFRVDPTTVEFAPAVWRLVKEKFPQLRRRVAISPNNEVGWAGAPASEKAAKEFGIETVAPTEYVDISSVEFSSILLKLLKQKPDIIDAPSTPGRVYALIVKQARELGYTGKIINVGIGDPDVVLERAGKEGAEGVLFPTIFGEPFPPNVVAFKKKYEAKWGEWNPICLNMSVYADMFVAGLKAADSIDVDKVKAALENPKFKVDLTIFGLSVFGGKADYGVNRQLLHPIPVSEIHDGKVRYLGMGKIAP
jgi:branched-chain amino acid transport system substrate-binding protein